jgi:prevent-host-death family protein
MIVEVASRELRNDTAGVLRQVEEGKRVVITRRGRPIADLVPHKASQGGWLTPAKVMEIRRIADGDPTWGAELAQMRVADHLDPIP